jgi:uncharacterized protein YfkK (UPF0435 family)
MSPRLLKKQKVQALKYLERLIAQKDPDLPATTIVSVYLSSLLEPEKYSAAKREDLRKLALEFGYTSKMSFQKWIREKSAEAGRVG